VFYEDLLLFLIYLSPWTIAGIVLADVVLTIIIVVATYRFARIRHRNIENANKVYMNVRANCKR
uniref:Hematopoietic cell signal transducer n=1 Tax=Cynoglossus semilaevis TaxID=244447 RepID=A0A3P8VET9_CYNSE